MAQRHITGFTKGMITDVVGAQDSVYYLKDAYVRRAGEIVNRGPVSNTYTANVAPVNYTCAAITQMKFHPDLGTISCGAIAPSANPYSSAAVGYQLYGHALQQTSASAAAGYISGFDQPALAITNLGEGTNNYNVYISASGGTAPIDWIQNMDTVANEVIMQGRNGRLFKWAGATKATYTTGGVSTTSSTNIISATAGSATQDWATNAEVGMYILIDGVGERTINGAEYQIPYRITNIYTSGGVYCAEVDQNLPTTVASASYRLTRLGLVHSPSGVWNTTDDLPRGLGAMTIHNGRIFTAGVSDNSSDFNTVYQLNRIRWSGVSGETHADHAGHKGYDLWHADGYVDIDPQGGAIKGIVSMGNELIILKQNAIYKLSSATPIPLRNVTSSISVSLIADSVGASGDYAYAMCHAGLVIASQNGLYLYNGSELKSLTHGRIQRYWEDLYSNFTMAVVAYDDKVIISNLSWPDQTALVWMIDDDYFWVMRSQTALLCGCSTFTSDDRYVADYGSYIEYVSNGANRSVSYDVLTHITHKSSTTLTDIFGNRWSSTGSASSLVPEVITNVIPLGESPVQTGRVNTILIACQRAASETYNPTVYVQTGNTSDGRYWHAAEGANTVTTLEYTLPTDGLDTVHRIPVDGIDDSPSAKIRIASAGGNGYTLRIYSIGVDYTPTGVVT